MKLIKFNLPDSMGHQKSIYVNPEHIEYISENNEGKTDIGFASGGNPQKVKETIDEVKRKLGIDD